MEDPTKNKETPSAETVPPGNHYSSWHSSGDPDSLLRHNTCLGRSPDSDPGIVQGSQHRRPLTARFPPKPRRRDPPPRPGRRRPVLRLPNQQQLRCPLGVLAPLQALDSSALLSELSDTELACIGDNPEKLARSLARPGSAPREEQAKLIGCLEDETLARIFLAGFVPDPGPLSRETSDCVRAGFAVIDPRTVMTAGIEGDPGRAMAGSMTALSVTIACLNDEEWEAAASMTGMQPEEREGMRCLLDQPGGPGEMAEAMKAAGEEDFTDLAKARPACGLDMGPAPGQASVTPSSDAHGDSGSAHSCLHARAGNCHVHTGPDRGGAHGDHNHLGDHSRSQPGGHPRI